MRLLEALLFAAAEPLDEKTLARGCPRRRCASGACALAGRIRARAASISCASATSGRSAPPTDLSWLLTQARSVETRKLSRAAIETLAIIAYHQPVTRAEIEEIRGVATSKGTLDVLLETGWIRPRGRRKAPGRPITYGTTEAFLSHFGLEEVGDLPGLEELKGAGPARRPPAARLLRCRCRPTIRRCATTKTRSSRAISISAWRRRPERIPRSDGAREQARPRQLDNPATWSTPVSAAVTPLRRLCDRTRSPCFCRLRA